VAGISGSEREGADSIVLSGGYEDDQDFGDLRYGRRPTERLDPAGRSRSPAGFRASITAVTAITEICPYPLLQFPLYTEGGKQVRACSTNKERAPPKKW